MSKPWPQKKKIVNETSDNRMETSKQGNDSGQTKTKQHVTANPYEIDSEWWWFLNLMFQ